MPADLDTVMVAGYPLVDTLYRTAIAPHKPRRRGRRAVLSDGEVLTLLLGQSEQGLLRHAATYWQASSPRLLSRSAVNRRARDLGPVCEQLTVLLAEEPGGPIRRTRPSAPRRSHWPASAAASTTGALPTTPSAGAAATRTSLSAVRCCWRWRWRWPLMVRSPASSWARPGPKDAGSWMPCGGGGPLPADPSGPPRIRRPRVHGADTGIGDRGGRGPSARPASGGGQAVPARSAPGHTVPTGASRARSGRLTGARRLAAGATVFTPAMFGPSPPARRLRGLQRWRQVVETVNAILAEAVRLASPQAKTPWGVVTRIAATCAAFNDGGWLSRLLGRPDVILATLPPNTLHQPSRRGDACEPGLRSGP